MNEMETKVYFKCKDWTAELPLTYTSYVKAHNVISIITGDIAVNKVYIYSLVACIGNDNICKSTLRGGAISQSQVGLLYPQSGSGK